METIPFYFVYLGMFFSAIGWLYLFFFLIDQGMPSGTLIVPAWALPPHPEDIDHYNPIRYTLLWSLVHIALPMTIGRLLIISAAGYYSVAEVWLSVILPGGLTHYPKAHTARELAFIQATLVAIAWYFKNKRLDAAEKRLDAMEKQLMPSQHNRTIARNMRNAISVIRKGQFFWMTFMGILAYAINGIFTIPILPCYVPNLFPLLDLLDPVGKVACDVISSIP